MSYLLARRVSDGVLYKPVTLLYSSCKRLEILHSLCVDIFYHTSITHHNSQLVCMGEKVGREVKLSQNGNEATRVIT